MSGDITVFLGKDCCREGNWMTDRICRFGCTFGVQDTEQEGGMWMTCAGKRYAFPV